MTAGSFNGRTEGSEPSDAGSSPVPAANLPPVETSWRLLDVQPSIPDMGPVWFSGYADTLLIIGLLILVLIEAACIVYQIL